MTINAVSFAAATQSGQQLHQGPAAPSRQSQASSASQEAQETAAQTKTEAAQGDVQAKAKLAQTSASSAIAAAVQKQAVPPEGTAQELNEVA